MVRPRPNYAFNNRRTVQKLQEMAEGGRYDTRQQIVTDLQGNSALVLTPADGIPAMSGGVPGSADCVLYYIDDAGEFAAVTAPGGSVTRKVYNVMESDIKGDTYTPAIFVAGVPIAISGGAFSCEDLCDCPDLYMKPEQCEESYALCCDTGTQPYPCGIDDQESSHVQGLSITGKDGYPSVSQDGASVWNGDPANCAWLVPVNDPTFPTATVTYNAQFGQWNVGYRDGSAFSDQQAPCSGSISFPFGSGLGVDSAAMTVVRMGLCEQAQTTAARTFVADHPDWLTGCSCSSDVIAVLDRWTPGDVSDAQMRLVEATIRNKKPEIPLGEIVAALRRIYR